MTWPPYSLDFNPIENLKGAKSRIDRVHPELQAMGNSQTTMGFIIDFAEDVLETLTQSS
jgi:hypothetical protein